MSENYDAEGTADAMVIEKEPELPMLRLINDPAEFLGDDTLPTDYVRLPRRGIRIKIRGIRSEERAQLEKRLEERKGKNHTKEINTALFREWLIISGSIKENGDQLFGSEHLQRMRKMPAADIAALADGIMKLSGMTEDDQEELVKN